MARRKKRFSLDPQFAQVTDLTHEGKGVARIDGKTTFISSALPGEEVEFIYTSKRRQYDEGKLFRVLKASGQRIKPGCQHFELCGGCSLQHLSPEDQIQMKQKVLLDNLQRIGHVTAEHILPPLTGPVWGYRTKARLGVKYVDKKQKLLIGFREKSSRYLADLAVCEVLHPAVGKNLDVLSELICSLSCYKAIPQLEIAVGDEMTAIVIRHLEALSSNDLKLLKEFAQRQRMNIYLQSGGPDTITPLWPEDPELYYSLPEYSLRYDFLPSDFTQVNTYINRKMIPKVIEELQCDGTQNILELFCGLGNFTLPLAKHVASVTAIEGEASLIKRAKANANKNHISNVDYHVANLMQEPAELAKLNWWKSKKYDAVFMDPPRSGAEQVLSMVSSLNANRIVYVSCNPATLARDAGVLVNDYGYTLTKTGVMDMFPHTAHVESLAVFEKG